MEYEIGLDLGVQSIGWSVKVGKKLVKLGVHCFDSGTGTADDIAKGKDESRNAARQAARSLRRQLQRRSQRSVVVARALQQTGLLPTVDDKGVPYNVGLAENRDRLIKDLDWELFSKFINDGDRVEAHLLPYLLRARALDKKLEPFEFGRALYHLSQRRGYLSNRKAVKESDEGEDDEGVVKADISKLESDIKDNHCRTLGEYFSKLDPEEKRIRQQYTSRQMYLDEFEAIWKKQAKYNPNLTDEAKQTIHRAIFFQRPLKSMRSKLGKCELVPSKRRAPVACLEFQRFRYWQKILDLKYLDANGDWQKLTPEELNLLAKELELNESLTFKEVKTLLGLKQNIKINLAEGGEKKLRGNVTAARLRKALPDRWDAMSEKEQTDLVNEILQFEREDALAKRLIKVYQFTPTEAQTVAATFLENGWAMYSKAALGKLLPYMRDNLMSFATATKELFNIQKKQSEPLDFLPPVESELGQIRNPVVTRTLTELRKVVNSIIRHAKKEGWGGKSGKPSRIFIELAREMKKSRKQREKDFKQNRKNEEDREDARKKIIKETGIKNPKPNDILKWLLAVECRWMCPYTGNTITPANLFGDHPQFDIEHILPFSRSLDNSFANKTLCDAKYNRDVKRNQTPYECASSDPDNYRKILERVKKFTCGTSGRGGNVKLQRFQMTKIPDGFANRVLNDTRYISRLACDYLGTLYGGQIDRTDVETDSDIGKRRIFVCTGQATAWVRREWYLNKILNDGDEKERSDHRHHAVDAAAIVYCTPEVVRKLASAAEQAEELNDNRRLFLQGEINEPYHGYWKDVAALVDEINVSYRCNKKVSGCLHDGTNYSKAHIEIDPKTGKEVEYRYLRKPLALMKDGEIHNIVDPIIQKTVLDKLERLGGKPKAFENVNELPYLTVKSKDGSQRLVPIKKARFRKTITVKKIGKGANERFVATDGNHHMEVYAILDKNGRETKWVADTVTLFDAYERLNNHQPIVNRDHGPGTVYKFTLYKNEFLLFTAPNGETVLKRIYLITGQRIGWGDHNDARPAKEVTDKTPGNRPYINTLRGLVQKVTVDFWGDIHPAND
ncbi:MAG: type II CRISPR RNA-guided endonuclease Cas9 [Thermoguttaceae bacterium]|nr:type II CRISPR RNA-guided endonuclease Cas9 [Thermoguttaceae bacterium]